MLTLRCTRKLLARLRVAPERVAEVQAPTTRLGDWHANLLYRPGGQLVLVVSDRALLPVLIAAKPSETIVPRFVEAVGSLLRRIGVPGDAVSAELASMKQIRIGRTASRQVLGTLTDFGWMLGAYALPGRSLEAVALHLAEAPCGPIGMRRPMDVAPRLLVSLKQGRGFRHQTAALAGPVR